MRELFSCALLLFDCNNLKFDFYFVSRLKSYRKILVQVKDEEIVQAHLLLRPSSAEESKNQIREEQTKI